MNAYFQSMLRVRELKASISRQLHLEDKINRFIRVSKVYIRKSYAISIDYEKRNELRVTLSNLKREAQQLYEEAGKSGQANLRRHEKRNTQFRGLEGNMRGNAKRFRRNLAGLIRHIELLDKNIALFRADNTAKLMTQTVKTLDSWYDVTSNKMKPPPGGGLLIGVALLLGIMKELTTKK